MDVAELGHVLHAQDALARSEHDALRPAPFHQCARRGVAIDQQLHFGGPRARRHDSADDTRRRENRHVALQTIARTLADGDRLKVGAGTEADDVSRGRGEIDALAQVEQLLELLAPLGKRPLFLQLDLQGIEARFELGVLGLHTSKPDIARPAVV